jgi:hypothetical protein
MPGHLQKLVKHGFMAVAELDSCRVQDGPALPTCVEGYVVSFVAFFEQGFDMPSHQFLHSLLRYYGLELHHLTPSGVLHIAAFVTLCEAYLEIDPELDLWKYFFCVWHPQYPKAELTISEGAFIHVKMGHEVDPYLEIPMPRSMKGWRKKWFYLRNDASAPFPTFTGGRLVPLPSWGDGVAQKDLDQLNPLHKNFQQLRQDGLTRMHLLRMFFSRQIQPLRRRRTKMWMYPDPSYPDRPSSTELSAVEVEARIHIVLDLGVNLTLCAGPVPLWRGIATVRVSTLGPVLVAFAILPFHFTHDLVQGLGAIVVSCMMLIHPWMSYGGRRDTPPARKRGRGRREIGTPPNGQ